MFYSFFNWFPIDLPRAISNAHERSGSIRFGAMLRIHMKYIMVPPCGSVLGRFKYTEYPTDTYWSSIEFPTNTCWRSIEHLKKTHPNIDRVSNKHLLNIYRSSIQRKPPEEHQSKIQKTLPSPNIYQVSNEHLLSINRTYKESPA